MIWPHHPRTRSSLAENGDETSRSPRTTCAAGYQSEPSSTSWPTALGRQARCYVGLLLAMLAWLLATSCGDGGDGPSDPDRPELTLSARSVNFSAQTGGDDPTLQSVTVTNSGGGTLADLRIGTLAYGEGEPTGWLTASLSGSPAQAAVNLNVTIGSLPEGEYHATVPVTLDDATNSPQNIAVTLTLTTPPAIQLSTTNVNFSATAGGSDPAPQTVTVTNGGGGELSGLQVGTITYEGGASGWLTTASLSGATAPATLTLQPSTADLAENTYTATVPIISDVASNTPQNVIVTFSVGATSAIVLSATSLRDSTPQSAAKTTSRTVNVTSTGPVEGLTSSVTFGSGEPTGWLTAALSSTTTPATLTLALQATTGTLARGTYTATVTIASTTPGVRPRSLTFTFRTYYTLALHVQPIFTTVHGTAPNTYTCASCHLGGGTGVLDLQNTDASYATLVEQPSTPNPSFPLSALLRVERGNPSDSYLYHVIQRTSGAEPMPPPPRDQLPADERQRVADWITDGAIKQ